MSTYYVNTSTGSDTYNGFAPVLVSGTVGPKLTVAAAIAAASSGDRVRISGTDTAASGGFVINKSLTLEGDSPTSTILYPNSAAVSQPVVKIAPAGATLNHIKLKNLSLKNTARPDAAKAGNYGLFVDMSVANSKIVDLQLDSVAISLMGDDGINMVATGSGDNYIVFCSMKNVFTTQNWDRGVHAEFVNLWTCENCYFNSNYNDGVYTHTCEPLFIHCAWEDNQRNLSADATFAAQCRVHVCYMPTWIAPHFESFSLSFPASLTIGATITGTGIQSSTTVASGGSAGTNTFVMSKVPDPAVVPAGTSLMSKLTISGTDYSNCILTNGSTTVSYGQANKHGINIEGGPGFKIGAGTLGNAVETTDATERGIFVDYSSGGNGYGIIEPQRFTNVKTAIELTNTTNAVTIYRPYVTGTGTIILPADTHLVSWT